MLPAAHWDEPAVTAAREQIARDAGAAFYAEFCARTPALTPAEALRREVERLMDADAKLTGLKQLQGLIWRGGYQSGVLKSHVFPDVPPALAAWAAHGLDIRIYSSGSAEAQRLVLRAYRGRLAHASAPRLLRHPHRSEARARELPGHRRRHAERTKRARLAAHVGVIVNYEHLCFARVHAALSGGLIYDPAG
ncbi:MAG: hypothetical protein ACREYE_21215 [Gammaproteobacteria bacterium]